MADRPFAREHGPAAGFRQFNPHESMMLKIRITWTGASRGVQLSLDQRRMFRQLISPASDTFDRFPNIRAGFLPGCAGGRAAGEFRTDGRVEQASS